MIISKYDYIQKLINQQNKKNFQCLDATFGLKAYYNKSDQ